MIERILIFFFIISCNEDKIPNPPQNEKDQNLSVFQLYSGRLCTVYSKTQRKKININCEKIHNFLSEKKWCQNSEFAAEVATFPGKDKNMKLCKESHFKNLKNHKNIRFLALGDIGRGQNPSKNYRQKQVAQAMHSVCPERKSDNESGCDFALVMGDLIYPSGVIDVWDRNFDKKFEDIYQKFENMPFYMIPGNHDYEGNIQAQIEYTYFSNKWIMPSLEYQIENLPSWLYIKTLDSTKFSNSKNSLNLTSDTKTNCQRHKWRIFAAHHPSVSHGNHGSNQNVSQNLLNVYEACSFNLYLSGHDHHMEHVQEQLFDSMILGGGGTNTKSVRKVTQEKSYNLFSIDNTPVQHFAKSIHGFAVIEISEKQMDIYFYDAAAWSYDDQNTKYIERPSQDDYAYHCRKATPSSPCLPVL